MVRRFETVVDQLKSQDADGLWVSLGSCDIHDSSITMVGPSTWGSVRMQQGHRFEITVITEFVVCSTCQL